MITRQTEPQRQWYTALKVSRQRVKAALGGISGSLDRVNLSDSVVVGATSEFSQKPVCCEIEWQNTLRRVDHEQVPESATQLLVRLSLQRESGAQDVQTGVRRGILAFG